MIVATLAAVFAVTFAACFYTGLVWLYLTHPVWGVFAAVATVCIATATFWDDLWERN